MFETPEIIIQIPDIKQVYKAVDKQIEKLTAAVEQMEDDIFLESMGEEKIKLWEKMLAIKPFDDDTLSDRRFRVQSKVLEKLPYSYRVIIRKLTALAPNGMEITRSDTNVTVKLAIASKKKIKDVAELLEVTLPLNMNYEVIIMFHTYGFFKEKKMAYGQMKAFSYLALRENEEVEK